MRHATTGFHGPVLTADCLRFAAAPSVCGRGAGAGDVHVRAAEGVGEVQRGVHGGLLLQELLGLQARLRQLNPGCGRSFTSSVQTFSVYTCSNAVHVLYPDGRARRLRPRKNRSNFLFLALSRTGHSLIFSRRVRRRRDEKGFPGRAPAGKGCSQS